MALLSHGEANDDAVERAGIRLNPLSPRASNEVLVAASRTALGAPIAIIDPHLSWCDKLRFYEERVYAGDFATSGVAILGIPFPSLGHSRFCLIAMTTGGPDTADVFEEIVNPANPRQYRQDGKWRDMEVRKFKIGAKNGSRVDEQREPCGRREGAERPQQDRCPRVRRSRPTRGPPASV